MCKVVIEIDQDSGFCFGVVNAINKAEQELQNNNSLYCLGDIVHNSGEVERLANLGLIVIDHTDLANLNSANVLLRAHGEPPSTYKLAESNNLKIIDATCPVVLRLQHSILSVYENNKNSQIVIYGKKGHAEVNGLVGQTQGAAIVVENDDDIERIDFSKPIYLFSQTTKSINGFQKLVSKINERVVNKDDFYFRDTICRQVANRVDKIRSFALKHELIFFVSGKKSSNGKALFEECKKTNERTYFVSSVAEIDKNVFNGVCSIGICGATSTPKWQMEAVKEEILKFI